MDQNIAELEREHQGLFQTVRPKIIEDLQSGKSALDVAKELEYGKHSSLKQMYKWVLTVEKEIERKRKQFAIRGMIFFWFGLVICSLGIILKIVAQTETPFSANISIPSILVILGLSLGIPGISWASNASKFMRPKKVLDN